MRRTLYHHIFFPLFGVMALCSVLVACGSTSTPFGDHTSAQHVYDRAAVLTSDEVASIETRIAKLASAGAPTIVYLRANDADTSQTIQDAKDLMSQWNIESSPGAKDGLVIFLNLKPGNLHHGQGAIYAGAHHFNGGNLPQYELDRIYNDVMLPLLKDGNIVAGINAGLDAAEQNLLNGAPPQPQPSAIAQVLGTVMRIPAAIVALVYLIFVASLLRRVSRARPAIPAPGIMHTTPPEALPPAIAGALYTRKISDDAIAATVLDLAGRGAIAIETTSKSKVNLRLLDSSRVQNVYEAALWQTLAQHADTSQVLEYKQIAATRRSWEPVREALRAEMIARGWFDPAARAFQRPLVIAGVVGLVLLILSFIASVIAQELWGILPSMIFLLMLLIAFSVASTLPETSAAGESQAGPWHDFARGLKTTRRDQSFPIDLDTVLPYALAMGTISALDKRMKAAGKAGFIPTWLSLTQHNDNFNFYPYWGWFYGSASATGASHSDGSAGASAGGGGAGGGF